MPVERDSSSLDGSRDSAWRFWDGEEWIVVEQSGQREGAGDYPPRGRAHRWGTVLVVIAILLVFVLLACEALANQMAEDIWNSL